MKVLEAQSDQDQENCFLYFSLGDDHFILSLSTLEDLMKVENVLKKKARLVKIKQRRNYLRSEDLSLLSSRATEDLVCVKFESVILPTKTAVESCVALLRKSDKWQIEEMHIRDHEMEPFMALTASCACIGRLHVHVTGPYLEELKNLVPLHDLFQVSYWTFFDCTASQAGDDFNMGQRICDSLSCEPGFQDEKMKGGLGAGNKKDLWRSTINRIAQILYLSPKAAESIFDQTCK